MTIEPVALDETFTVTVNEPDEPAASVPRGQETVPAAFAAGVVQPAMPPTDAKVVCGGVTRLIWAPRAWLVPPFAYRIV